MSTPDSATILLSGSYIIASLISEFGVLPPSFLPLSNRRLYQWQIEQVKPISGTILLTIPEGFKPEVFDMDWLSLNGVQLLATEENLSIGQAFARSLSALPDHITDVWVYYGDTLIPDFGSLSENGVFTGKASDFCRWGYCKKTELGSIEFHEDYHADENVPGNVIVGGFRFRRRDIEHCLKLANNDLMACLNIFSIKYGLNFHDVGCRWYDFGHLHTYFQSRQNFTTERAFNQLRVENRTLSKLSIQAGKMKAEANWFYQAPSALRVFLPGYMGETVQDNMTGYTLEYLFLTPLNDLFVFGRLPERVWDRIMAACHEFHDLCCQHDGPEMLVDGCQHLYLGKTEERLLTFSRQRSIPLDQCWTYNGKQAPSLRDMFLSVAKHVNPTKAPHIKVTHGDFHFANIFYDSRSLGIKVVDPRGEMMGEQHIYGDRRYDVAKLAHSVFGLYDFIISGLFQAVVSPDYSIDFHIGHNPQIAMVQNVFARHFWNNGETSRSEILAIIILLFLSMLPLHGDDPKRQDTLMANAFRLYFDLQNLETLAA
jgi:hypothetical protein